jgi:hypothetical protein
MRVPNNVARFESAIVRIRTADGTVVGTGFLVADRQVLTCTHVVDRALGLPDGTSQMPEGGVHLDFPLSAPKLSLTARIVRWQPESDVAGLELDGDLPPDVQPVRLVTAEEFWGHACRAFGFPARHDDGVWASGELRARQAAGWVEIEDVKVTGYWVQAGFSGAPVWDEQLEGVVGMVVAAESEAVVKAAFIIPCDMLIKTWPELGKQAMSRVLISSVQGGVDLREAVSIIVEPSLLAIPLPRVRVFEPLQPFNRFFMKKLRLDKATAVLVSFVLFLLIYAGGIWGFRRLMNTPYPGKFTDWLHVAPGFAFYYPDWNAVTFDGILNPILASLASIFPFLIAERLTMLFSSNLLQMKDSPKSGVSVQALVSLFPVTTQDAFPGGSGAESRSGQLASHPKAMAIGSQKDLSSLQRQLDEAGENLRLIQERKAEYVLGIDIPLQLKKEERRLLSIIAKLEQQIGQMERRPKPSPATETPTLEEGSERTQSWLLELPPWTIFGFSLLLAIITVIGSWFSRYQFYVSDLLSFRFYALFLVGLSTYVRWSLLILTVQTVLWILRSDFKPVKELFRPGGENAIYPLGELAILLLLAFYGLMAYAIATIGTSFVKGVPIEIDALFWEAIAHLIVSLVGCVFILAELVYQPYWALQQLRDDVENEIAKEDVPNRQARLNAVEKASIVPIWRAARRQTILLIPFFLLTLMPLFLWIGGLIATG